MGSHSPKYGPRYESGGSPIPGVIHSGQDCPNWARVEGWRAQPAGSSPSVRARATAWVRLCTPSLPYRL